MADNKKYIRSMVCTWIVMAAAFAFCHISVSAEENDWVEIVSVTPNSYDNYTDSVTFTATINYSLQSAEQGIVYLGFNTSRPNYYEVDEEPGTAGKVVAKGQGTVVLSKEVTPVNWDTAVSRMQQYMEGISYPVTDFKVYANLSEYPHDIPWTPLAIFESVLTQLPETEAASDKSGQGYSDEQLCDMARRYYEINSGVRPEFAVVDHVEGDMVVVHLYDNAGTMTATYDWYKVNRYTAKGTNFLGEAIDLTVCERPETAAPEYKIYCGEGYPNGYEVFDCSLEDCLSKTNSVTYTPQLAHMLTAMCNSVYDDTDMRQTFQSFGFEGSDVSYDMWDGIFLGYGMAKKKLEDGKTLILVVARGTEEGIEWVSNADIRLNVTNGQHMGFSDAADALYDRMTEFLGTRDFSGTKFVITGFSRGAAAANILAGRLVDEKVAQSQIYAYTFACPDVGVMSQDKADSYHCIFNIANANDLVSWIPQTILGSGWNKFGRSYWYSDVWGDYEELEMGTTAHNQKLYLDYLRSEKPVSEYRRRKEAQEALDAAAMRRTLDFLHKSAYRNARVIHTGVYCPVDVEIYTSDGRLAGRATDDTAEALLADKVYLSVDGDRKHIYFLDEDRYTLRLTATDNGMMYYTVQSIDVETQETLEEKVFPTVALIEGRKMESGVAVGEDGDADTDGVRLFALDGEGVSISEIQEDGTEIPLGEIKDTERSEKEGIPLIPVSAAVAAALALIGAVIFYRGAVKREKSRPCSSCGRQVDFNASFCMYCGTKISKNKPHKKKH